MYKTYLNKTLNTMLVAHPDIFKLKEVAPDLLFATFPVSYEQDLEDDKKLFGSSLEGTGIAKDKLNENLDGPTVNLEIISYVNMNKLSSELKNKIREELNLIKK